MHVAACKRIAIHHNGPGVTIVAEFFEQVQPNEFTFERGAFENVISSC